MLHIGSNVAHTKCNMDQNSTPIFYVSQSRLKFLKNMDQKPICFVTYNQIADKTLSHMVKITNKVQVCLYNHLALYVWARWDHRLRIDTKYIIGKKHNSERSIFTGRYDTSSKKMKTSKDIHFSTFQEI